MTPQTAAQSAAFTSLAPGFAEVTGDAPQLLRIAETDAHEGPVYAADEHALYFTTVPGPRRRVSIKRLDLRSGAVSVVREDANVANGMALGRDGRLVVCEQGTRSRPAGITLVDRRRGSVEPLLAPKGADRLNSPNDVVVKRDGTVWFTDPSYGWLQGFRPRPARADAVYRFDPGTGDLDVVAGDFDKPNGLCFSPDESVLYVTDSGANHEPGSYDPARPHHVRAFDVAGGSRLEGGDVFAVVTPGFPDGLKADSEGRIYASAFDGVHVFGPDGTKLGRIELHGAVNFTFGGPGRDVLFITADTAIHAALLRAKGA